MYARFVINMQINFVFNDWKGKQFYSPYDYFIHSNIQNKKPHITRHGFMHDQKVLFPFVFEQKLISQPKQKL